MEKIKAEYLQLKQETIERDKKYQEEFISELKVHKSKYEREYTLNHPKHLELKKHNTQLQQEAAKHQERVIHLEDTLQTI